MIAGMLFAQREQCGIAIFTRDVIRALEAYGTSVLPINTDASITRILSECKKCDVVHVQYETGFFMNGPIDRYRLLMNKIDVPCIVSLHEVYDEDPFACPRSRLNGNVLTLAVKRIIWDLRHPVQRAALRHRRAGYYASKIVTFYHYQKRLLQGRGCDADSITVLSKPVPVMAEPGAPVIKKSRQVHLGAMGFINPSYDYDLLFATLDLLTIPWKFSWIGGATTRASRLLTDTLARKIAMRGWEERFVLTGWVSQDDLYRCIRDVDIALALFGFRSTSGSLLRLMGAQKAIIATRLPLTDEIALTEPFSGKTIPSKDAPLILVEREAAKVAAAIERYTSDISLQRKLHSSLREFTRQASFSRYAEELSLQYRSMAP